MSVIPPTYQGESIPPPTTPSSIGLDVVALGADPTGVADSSTAIQTAINLALANMYLGLTTKVWIPSGTYRVTTTLRAPYTPGQLTIEGAGRDSTMIFADPAINGIGSSLNAALISAQTSVNCSGITWDGGCTVQSASVFTGATTTVGALVGTNLPVAGLAAGIVGTTVAAGSNGQTLTQLTANGLQVTNVGTAYTSGGLVQVATSSGQATLKYSGVSGSTLTGISIIYAASNTATVTSGNIVTSVGPFGFLTILTAGGYLATLTYTSVTPGVTPTYNNIGLYSPQLASATVSNGTSVIANIPCTQGAGIAFYLNNPNSSTNIIDDCSFDSCDFQNINQANGNANNQYVFWANDSSKSFAIRNFAMRNCRIKGYSNYNQDCTSFNFCQSALIENVQVINCFRSFNLWVNTGMNVKNLEIIDFIPGAGTAGNPANLDLAIGENGTQQLAVTQLRKNDFFNLGMYSKVQARTARLTQLDFPGTTLQLTSVTAGASTIFGYAGTPPLPLAVGMQVSIVNVFSADGSDTWASANQTWLITAVAGNTFTVALNSSAYAVAPALIKSGQGNGNSTPLGPSQIATAQFDFGTSYLELNGFKQYPGEVVITDSFLRSGLAFNPSGINDIPFKTLTCEGNLYGSVVQSNTLYGCVWIESGLSQFGPMLLDGEYILNNGPLVTFTGIPGPGTNFIATLRGRADVAANTNTLVQTVGGGGTLTFSAIGSCDIDNLCTSKGILGYSLYAPSSVQAYGTTSNVIAPVDTANAAVTFTAPWSGSVDIDVQVSIASGTSSDLTYLCLLDTSNNLVSKIIPVTSSTATLNMVTIFKVANLTPGKSYTYRLGWANGANAATSNIHAQGYVLTGPPYTVAVNGIGSPLAMRVQAHVLN